MPLNIQDPEERRPIEPKTPDMTETTFKAEPQGGNRKLLLWIFAIVVLASAFFLLIQFRVIPIGGVATDPSSPAETKTGEAPATPVGTAESAPIPAQGGTAAITPRDQKADSARAAELRQRLAAAEGEYTIFISAFSAAPDAEELAGRWERAGYRTAIQHAGGWYRVGIGRFATVSSAREEAEKIRQALEEGYWVGRVTPD